MRFSPLSSTALSPFCTPMFSSEYVLDCVAGVRRRGTGGGEKRERGMRFSPLPSTALSPFCTAMFSSECVLDSSEGEGEEEGRGERGEEEEKKGEGNALFSPSPPPLPPLFVPPCFHQGMY